MNNSFHSAGCCRCRGRQNLGVLCSRSWHSISLLRKHTDHQATLQDRIERESENEQPCLRLPSRAQITSWRHRRRCCRRFVRFVCSPDVGASCCCRRNMCDSSSRSQRGPHLVLGGALCGSSGNGGGSEAFCAPAGSARAGHARAPNSEGRRALEAATIVRARRRGPASFPTRRTGACEPEAPHQGCALCVRVCCVGCVTQCWPARAPTASKSQRALRVDSVLALTRKRPSLSRSLWPVVRRNFCEAHHHCARRCRWRRRRERAPLAATGLVWPYCCCCRATSRRV